jgi:hypothetical protein
MDQEMSDAELTFHNESDYILRYRRVLDHFDAVSLLSYSMSIALSNRAAARRRLAR